MKTLAIFSLIGVLAAEEAPYFATGAKVGEVDQHSAIIWARLTEKSSANFDQLPIFTEGLTSKEKDNINMPLGVVPGIAGEVRVGHKQPGAKKEFQYSPWKSLDAKTDFSHQFHLTDLLPNQHYDFIVESRKDKDSNPASTIDGGFHTAPEATAQTPIRFIVSTCQAVRSIDSGADGHLAYKQMLGFKPHFFVHTGDILYYDKAPLAKSVAQARAKWNLMFAYKHNQNFHRQVSSYFMKDDHDTLKNDCWPGQTYGDLTFDQGLSIFREQIPMGEKTYRTIRWGKDVQIWLTENRDFRSSNRDQDGPNKTILGAEQKAWLKKTMSESDATYKFLITPGPIVGPDKRGKSDNHSNKAFFHEGQELRDFLAPLKNTYVICGDRHWQYCSKDPGTGLIELGCGPINDEHSYGGNPGENPMHRYFSAKGGFLGITVENGEAKAEWYSTNEGPLKVRHTEKL
ncbi:alkaline phosphatase D family protein [Akkermansiaceae bacterium]|nr:alkaline phosphatase D family protein [Akkermansiaceae bacterium]